MGSYQIVLEQETGMRNKLVRVYLEQNGEYRQLQRSVREEVDVKSFIPARFEQLWSDAEPLPEYEWLAAMETTFRSLYQQVAREAVKVLREEGSSLADVTGAMEDVIAASGRGEEYAHMKALAKSATAAERDAFFLAAAFVILGQSAAK